MNQARFTDKVVVVTGAAQGIGSAVAVAMAQEGARVVLVDRSDLVKDVYSDILAHGQTASYVLADLEQYEGAQNFVDHAIAEFGHIDVLVNNVGGTIWRKPFEHYSPAEVQAELTRSLLPTLWGCHAVLPHLISRRAGTIVNVSSNATRSVNRVPYAAAKGGINALTASLAFEAAQHGIRVVATAPGGTVAPERIIPRHPGTPTADELRWHAETEVQSTESTLMKRFGTIDEQVGPILFLASDAASYITGSVLPVAGGDLG